MCTRLLFLVYSLHIFHVYCANESDILFELYTDTRGAEWNGTWDVATIYSDPCSLFGVVCNDITNNVTELGLGSNNLNGSLPSSICNLNSLLHINMTNNNLFGNMPVCIFNHIQLLTIDFSHNLFSGTITFSASINNNLTQIHLNSNRLAGSIPSNIDMFANLTVLSLQDNELSSSIPSNLSALQNIEFIYLHNNHLKHSIPRLPNSVYGATFHSNDFTFDIEDTGQNNNGYYLSDFLSDLNTKPNLNAITLHDNVNLQGHIPKFNTSTLKIFTAHSCSITKTLPSNKNGIFLPTHISLINNRLSSTIATDFITPYDSDTPRLDIALFAQGNKFDFEVRFKTLNQMNIPKWIVQSVLNTNSGQLWNTNQLKILEFIIITIVFLIAIFEVAYHIHRMRKERQKKQNPTAYMELKKNDPLYSIVHQIPYSFFSQLKDIAKYLYFIPTLSFAVITSIIYFVINIETNQYYTSADFLLKWSITYIASDVTQFNLSQWVASVYTTLYCAFTLYLYYIFYYTFTFPILFYQKMQITKKQITVSPKRRKSSHLMVQSNSEEKANSEEKDTYMYQEQNNEEEYIYTLSGEKKPKSSFKGRKKHKAVIGSVVTRPRSVDIIDYDTNQQTKLLDNQSQIHMIEKYQRNRYNSVEIEESMDSISINLIYSPSRGSISLDFSDNSSDESEIGRHKKQITMISHPDKSFKNEYNTDQVMLHQSNYENSDIEIHPIYKKSKVSTLTNSTMAMGYGAHQTGWLKRHRKLNRGFKTILWSIVFLICELLIIFYFATVSFANNNVFNIDFNHWTYSVLRYSVWLIIALCNSFVIPRISKKLVKKVLWICFEWNRQEKSHTITIISTFIRSLNLVWLPMFLLFVFHNDCGRFNNYYWQKCRESADDHQFEFNVGTQLISIKKSLCSFGFFDTDYAVDYGKCFRSILEEWALIIIFSSFGYIVCMMGFWLYSVIRYHRKLKAQYASGARKVGSIINVEYAEIWNHVQIVVLFGCSLPLVIPIIAFVLLINKWVYSSLLALNFRLSNVNPYFPARLLLVTNGLQQISIILFMWFNDMKPKYFVIIADVIIDLGFLIWWFWYRNVVAIPKQLKK